MGPSASRRGLRAPVGRPPRLRRSPRLDPSRALSPVPAPPLPPEPIPPRSMPMTRFLWVTEAWRGLD
eukprot:scaffold7973_cov19-Tisochrysis_lutea.AAC.1